MKKLFLFVVALSVCALAAEDSLKDRVNGLQAQIDRAMSKAGIHFNGEFRSQFLSSTVEGDAAGPGKKHESAEYTSVDFDVVARPNTALSARAMFRMHQDWRNFFSDVQNPITTRWLSIDGSLMSGIINYNLGDYQKKITPLTLWSPDIEFMFEPEIFKESREFAMSEAFVGDNLRSLQGANVGFKAELYPYLPEVEVGLFAARLAARGTGESGVIAPGVATTADGGYWDRDYDKYLIGANLAAQVVKGAGAGITDVLIYDHLASYRGDTINAKLNSEWTNVFAGRVDLDNRMFMEDDFINIGFKAEGALSIDRRRYSDPGNASNVLDNNVTGIAFNANLGARVAFGEDNSIRFSADLIYNDSSFRNDAAQSPSFLQRAILNSENGLEGLGVMNPFDALYRSVFKYAPSQYFGGAKPYTKNAYTNAILTKGQVGSIEGVSGIVRPGSFPFQAALPGGMATADRIGPVIGLCGGFLDNGINVGAKIAMLQSYEMYSEFKRKYDEIIGGASVDIAKFAPAVGPSLVLGGSFGMYNQKPYDNVDITNNLISLGLSYNFLPRFSVLAGYQLLNSSHPETSYEDPVSGDTYVAKYDYVFSNTAFGFSYKVADGGYVTFKLSMLTGYKEGGGTRFEVDEMNPDNSGVPVPFSIATDYWAMQPEVYLTVKF
jgi:hypothetical protein